MNPIIPGFAPDPTIIRVDDTYYAVNSSFHIFPCLPVFTSKDLVNWTHIGAFLPLYRYLPLVSLRSSAGSVLDIDTS